MAETENSSENRELEHLEKNEKARRIRALVIGLSLTVLIAGGFIFIASNRDTYFKPKLDIEAGEKDLLELTNDPQCRELIDEVTLIGFDYAETETKIADGLLKKDGEELKMLINKTTQLRERLKSSEATVHGAALRFDDSRSELRKWFKHVDLELSFLERLGTERLNPEPEEKSEGTIVSDKRTKAKKTPEQRLDGALLATTEAFDSFRVWHTGGMHPCGKADKDETPWRPPSKTITEKK